MVNWSLKKAETSFHAMHAEVCPPIFLILLEDTPIHASRGNLVSAFLYFIYLCEHIVSYTTQSRKGLCGFTET